MAEHVINFVEGEGIAIQAAVSADTEMWDVEISNTIGTLLDAKGDLLTATGSDVAARLPAGTNGQVLTADSTAATGLKWAAAPAGALLWEDV